jgi:signal transduction histidine kinase
VRLLSAGIGIFLISFTGGNVYGTLTDDWVVGAVGLFGMILLALFIAFSIVRYQTFNSRVIATQFLVLFIIFLIGTQLFNYESQVGLILTMTTLLLSSVAGFFLVRSVKYEIQQKENLERIGRSLAQANERLKELDTAKSEFISIASHQLRTPLTAIKGYVSLVLEGSYGAVSNDVQDVLNKVYSVNNRLAQLVEDLLNISRIEAGRIQYNFVPTQLADLLAELHDMFLLPAKEKGLDFTLTLPEPHLPKIIVDPNKIKEVISNLTDNAIKYTPEGKVNLSLEAHGANARITISDTGIGINQDDKDNLFSKFVRSKETSRMVVGGAGLGLYVGKSFVLAHKGNIWADSEGPGKGSQFIIELPIVNTGLQAGTTEKAREE